MILNTDEKVQYIKESIDKLITSERYELYLAITDLQDRSNYKYVDTDDYESSHKLNDDTIIYLKNFINTSNIIIVKLIEIRNKIRYYLSEFERDLGDIFTNKYRWYIMYKFINIVIDYETSILEDSYFDKVVYNKLRWYDIKYNSNDRNKLRDALRKNISDINYLKTRISNKWDDERYRIYNLNKILYSNYYTINVNNKHYDVSIISDRDIEVFLYNYDGATKLNYISTEELYNSSKLFDNISKEWNINYDKTLYYLLYYKMKPISLVVFNKEGIDSILEINNTAHCLKLDRNLNIPYYIISNTKILLEVIRDYNNLESKWINSPTILE